MQATMAPRKARSRRELPIGVGGQADTTNELVGRRIREARKARGWNLEDFSAQAGISIAQLSKMETGKATLTIPGLMKIGRTLERPLSYFLQTDSEMPRCLGTLVPSWDAEGRALGYFAELVKEKTDGQLTIVVFSASQLGPAIGQVEALMTGVIDMFVEALSFYERYANVIRVASLPYCFDDDGHYERFLTSQLFEQEVRRVLRERSVELLNPEWNWRRGPYTVLVSRRLITSPNELRGVRVRSYESEVMVQFLERLGAVPVVVPWARVYEAFGAGEFDAMITNLSHVVSMRFTRIARYLTVLGYRPLDLAIAVNAQKYHNLSPSLQLALQEAAVTAGKHCADLVARAEDEIPALLEQDNAVVSRVNVMPWRERARAAIQELEQANLWKRGLFRQIQEVREAR